MNAESTISVIVFVVVVAVIAVILYNCSYETQAIVITVLVIIAFAGDRILLHFFREYFARQWYFISINSWKRGDVDSIIVPFIFIGAIVYWIAQRVIFMVVRRK